MAEKLPYFPFYVNDFLTSGDVAQMTPEAVGGYILLLCMAWHQDPPATIPADDATLARWARMTPDRWEVCKRSVLTAFVPCETGRLSSPRLREEYDKAVCQHRRNVENGRAGAAKKYSGKPGYSPPIAPLQPGYSNQNQNQSQKDPKPKDSAAPPRPPPELDTPAFAAVWSEYVAYRRERGIASLKPLSVSRQWEVLAKYGERVAITAIETTIRQGWTGIFPEKASAATQLFGTQGGSPADRRREAVLAGQHPEHDAPQPRTL